MSPQIFALSLNLLPLWLLSPLIVASLDAAVTMEEYQQFFQSNAANAGGGMFPNFPNSASGWAGGSGSEQVRLQGLQTRQICRCARPFSERVICAATSTSSLVAARRHVSRVGSRMGHGRVVSA